MPVKQHMNAHQLKLFVGRQERGESERMRLIFLPASAPFAEGIVKQKMAHKA
jgi:hypothetical protein